MNNSLTTQSTKSLYATYSQFNHSCTPNASATVLDDTNLIAVRALRTIQKGTEICLSYKGGVLLLPYEQRQAELTNLVSCLCPVCSLPPAKKKISDERRRRVRDLIGMLFSEDACVGPDDLHELALTLDAEQLSVFAIDSMPDVETVIKQANGAKEARESHFNDLQLAASALVAQ